MSIKETRRIHVSRDLAKQSVHYLLQYHNMFVIWAVKTIEQQPRGIEREKFREGICHIFTEIQQCVARLQDDLGETPESIGAVLAELKTPQYQKAVDKVMVQAYVHRVKKAAMPWRWPVIVIDALIGGTVWGLLYLSKLIEMSRRRANADAKGN